MRGILAVCVVAMNPLALMALRYGRLGLHAPDRTHPLPTSATAYSTSFKARITSALLARSL